MKKENQELVKILMNNGTAVMMYMDKKDVAEMRLNTDYFTLSDDGSDYVYLRKDSVLGFEVISDRVIEEINPNDVPPIPPQEINVEQPAISYA
jgi:hypothetical protein